MNGGPHAHHPRYLARVLARLRRVLVAAAAWTARGGLAVEMTRLALALGCAGVTALLMLMAAR